MFSGDVHNSGDINMLGDGRDGDGDTGSDGDVDGGGNVDGDGDTGGDGDVDGDGNVDGEVDHVSSDGDAFSDDDVSSDVSDDAGDDNDVGGDSDMSIEDDDGTGGDNDTSANGMPDDPNKSKKKDSFMSNKIYSGSQVTVLEAYCLLMELKRICRLSFTTMVMLLSLLQILCPAGNLLPTSKHQLLKFAYQFKSKHSRIDYCRSCGDELESSCRCPSNTCRKEEPNSILLFSPNQAIQRIIRGKLHSPLFFSKHL